jgi:acyl-CoA synthetase (AMP-forming)/AMP-acid ligase II
VNFGSRDRVSVAVPIGARDVGFLTCCSHAREDVMKGYLNRPEANKETIVEGGWLRTGDIAMVKGDHFYITDRIKELVRFIWCGFRSLSC